MLWGTADSPARPALIRTETMYDYQDVKDDRVAGVKSTAVLLSSPSRVRQILWLSGAALVASLAAVGLFAHLGLAYFAITVGGGAAHVVWQVSSVQLDVPASCWGTWSVRCAA